MTWYRNLDLFTVLLWAALVACGLLAIYSTTHGPASEYLLETVKQNFQRQAMWATISAVGVVILLMIPLRTMQALAYPAYVFCLGLLVTAMVMGTEVSGAKSWIRVGPVGIQVSEIAKVGTVMAVAKLLASRKPNTQNVRVALGAVGLLVVPAVLIILQNDTGTALVFLGLVPIMLFWSGLPLHIVALMIAPGVAGYFAIVYPPVAIGFAVLFTIGLYIATRDRLVTLAGAAATGGVTALVSFALTKILQPYQVARVVSFTNPEAEEYRRGVGFHLVQSKSAIGSGGIFGKGFMEGTQTQGAYIPEQSTDFIFSVIGEEFGFLGGLVVLVLFLLLLCRMIWLGTQVKHPFGSMVAAGAVGIYLIHIFINIGMVTGLLPVIGIPLPFLSYGGSAMLANTAMLGIVLNLHMRRDNFSIYGY